MDRSRCLSWDADSNVSCLSAAERRKPLLLLLLLLEAER